MKRKRKTELKKSVEGMLNQLPPELQEAVKSGDMENFMAIVEKMPIEQTKALLDALEPMMAKLGFAPKRRKGLDMEKVLRDLDPFLQDIAAVAKGEAETGVKARIEEVLALDGENREFSDAVHRIWNGERDPAALASALDPNSTRFVHRILELIDGK